MMFVAKKKLDCHCAPRAVVKRGGGGMPNVVTNLRTSFEIGRRYDV